MKHKIVNPDEFRVGDVYANGLMDHAVQSRSEVLEVDVIQEAEVDGETKMTAGVVVQPQGSSWERFISYETLADRDFRVWRPEANLTEEEKAEIREAHK